MISSVLDNQTDSPRVISLKKSLKTRIEGTRGKKDGREERCSRGNEEALVEMQIRGKSTMEEVSWANMWLGGPRLAQVMIGSRGWATLDRSTDRDLES